MAQFLRPISDRTISGAWVNQAGGTTDLYLAIDEVTLDNTDYVQTGNNPGSTDLYECGLSTGAAPVAGNHIVRYTIGKSATSGRTIEFIVRLFNSDNSQVAAWTHSNIDTETSYAQTLTSGQIAAINSYTGLYIRINPTTSGGGAARAGRAYHVEFEIPDAPATSPITGNTALTFSIAAALLKGIAKLVGSAGAIVQTTGHLLGVGSISGSAVITVSSTGNLTNQPAGDVVGSSSVTFTGVASLKGRGSLDAVSQITVASTGVIKGVTLLSANELIQISTSGVVKGIGSLAGNSGVLVETSSILKGVGSIQTTTPVEISTSAILTGNGVLIGSIPIGIDSNGIVKGIGVLAGNPNIEILAFGDLQNVVFDNLSGATQIRFEASGRAGQEGAKAGGSLTNTISIQI